MMDSTVAERNAGAQPEYGAEPDQGVALARTPVLGLLATAAALLDLTVNRVAVRSLGEAVSREAVLTLSRWGSLPRNLAAVAGLVALTIALLAFLRSSTYGPVRRRLALAGFAGVFLPTTALATFLPTERTTTEMILFGVGAANVLAVLLGVIAVRLSSPRGIRIGIALGAASCFCGFLSLVLPLVEPLTRVAIAMHATELLRRVGEVAFLSAPGAVAFSIVPRDPSLRSRIAMAVGVFVAFAVVAFVIWGKMALRSDFDVILYGAMRVRLFLGFAPALYSVPFAIGFGAASAALLSGDPTRRQGGAAVMLFLGAGYAPTAPGQLLMLVLAMALLTRSSVTLGELAVNRRRTLATRDSLEALDRELSD